MSRKLCQLSYGSAEKIFYVLFLFSVKTNFLSAYKGVPRLPPKNPGFSASRQDLLWSAQSLLLAQEHELFSRMRRQSAMLPCHSR